MPKSIYEVTQKVVTDNDGMVSIEIIRTREITSLPEEEQDEDNNTGES